MVESVGPLAQWVGKEARSMSTDENRAVVRHLCEKTEESGSGRTLHVIDGLLAPDCVDNDSTSEDLR
jgi:hypothetical protein